MNKLYELLNEVSVDLGEYKEQELSELETKRIKKNVLNEIKVRKKQNNTKWTTFAKACACVVLILGAGSIGIAAASGQLPEEIKEIVILYFFQGLKQKEIADLLNIKLSLVKYRVSKAKELLAKQLGVEKL